MCIYYRGKTMKGRSEQRVRRSERETASLSLNKGLLSQNPQPLPRSRSGGKTAPLSVQQQMRIFKDEPDQPLSYHAACIIQGVWKWFKGRTLLARILITLIALYVVSLFMNAIIQFMFPSLGLVYTL